jgi:hypothetical protein
MGFKQHLSINYVQPFGLVRDWVEGRRICYGCEVFVFKSPENKNHADKN